MPEEKLREFVQEMTAQFDLAYDVNGIVADLRVAFFDIAGRHAYPQDSPQSKAKRVERQSVQWGGVR